VILGLTKQSVQPHLYNSRDAVISTNQRELLACLKCTVLGISSQLHTWNPTTEKFMQVGTEKGGKNGILLVDGKDEVVASR